MLQAFQAKALEVNEKINAVVEFLEDALARAKYLVTSHNSIILAKGTGSSMNGKFELFILLCFSSQVIVLWNSDQFIKFCSHFERSVQLQHVAIKALYVLYLNPSSE